MHNYTHNLVYSLLWNTTYAIWLWKVSKFLGSWKYIGIKSFSSLQAITSIVREIFRLYSNFKNEKEKKAQLMKNPEWKMSGNNRNFIYCEIGFDYWIELVYSRLVLQVCLINFEEFEHDCISTLATKTSPFYCGRWVYKRKI